MQSCSLWRHSNVIPLLKRNLFSNISGNRGTSSMMTSFEMTTEMSRILVVLGVVWFPSDASFEISLQWRHNEHNGVSNHQPHDCLLKRLFRRRSKKTSKLRVTGLCEGIPPVTGEFPAQRASNAEILSIWWRHHVSECIRIEYILFMMHTRCYVLLQLSTNRF